MNTFKHKDYFGTEVNVGDIVLSARGAKSHYQDTEYAFCVIIKKTPKMIRVHKLGNHPADLCASKATLLTAVKERQGRQGGKVVPYNVIYLKSTGITEQEFDAALVKTSTIKVKPFLTLFP